MLTLSNLIAITVFSVYTTGVVGLDCLKCIDATVNISSLPKDFQPQAEEYEKILRTPECTNATSSISGTNVTFDACINDPGYGKINKCGVLTGTLILKFVDLDIPVKIVIKDCFGVDPSTGNECLSDKTVLENQQRIMVDRYESRLQPLGIGGLTGQLCVNGSPTLRVYYIFTLFVIMIVNMV